MLNKFRQPHRPLRPRAAPSPWLMACAILGHWPAPPGVSLTIHVHPGLGTVRYTIVGAYATAVGHPDLSATSSEIHAELRRVAGQVLAEDARIAAEVGARDTKLGARAFLAGIGVGEGD
jgi:hypothetical protein